MLGSHRTPHLWAPALLPAVHASSEMHVGLASKTAATRHQDLTSDNCNVVFPLQENRGDRKRGGCTEGRKALSGNRAEKRIRRRAAGAAVRAGM